MLLLLTCCFLLWSFWQFLLPFFSEDLLESRAKANPLSSCRSGSLRKSRSKLPDMGLPMPLHMWHFWSFCNYWNQNFLRFNIHSPSLSWQGSWLFRLFGLHGAALRGAVNDSNWFKDMSSVGWPSAANKEPIAGAQLEGGCLASIRWDGMAVLEPSKILKSN